MGELRTLALIVALCAGCSTPSYFDSDGDGAADGADCGPANPEVHPGALDVLGDLIDSDCDGVDGVDRDDDGVAAGPDCNDSDPLVGPDAAEIPDNGIDEDCDGTDLVCDGDGDGASIDHPGCASPVDCDDTIASCTQDCTDADGDGQAACAGDCDDEQPSVGLGFPEVCDGLDSDCDGEELAPDEVDLDGDGVAPCSGDCDEGSPLRFAGNTEGCDGLDSDCDPATEAEEGELDADGDGYLPCAPFVGLDPAGFLGGADCDDADPLAFPGAVWCVDADGDSEGDPDSTGDPCVGPADLVPLCGDCDDANALVGSLQTEVCDGFDGDCDPTTAPVGGEADLDDDGWVPCMPFVVTPSTLLSGGGDCDDLRPDTNPAGVEVCNGRDDDCSGASDEAWDADGDGVGPCAAFGLCDAATDCTSDCDDADPLVRPRQPDLQDGADRDCDGTDATGLTTPWTSLLGSEAEATFGGAFASGGDVDGDGLDDLLVGPASPGGSTGGAPVRLFLSGATMSGSLWDAGDAAVTLLPEDADDNAGVVLAFAGDVDGDGLDDLLVAAPERSEGAINNGVVYLVLAADLPASGSISLGSSHLRIGGLLDGWMAGDALGDLGDLDGDGLADFFVSTIRGHWSQRGQVSVFLGVDVAAGGLIWLSDASATVHGTFFGARAGAPAAGGLDITGDGIPDLVVGAPYVPQLGQCIGSVHVLSGAQLTPGSYRPLTSAWASIDGDVLFDYVGLNVALVPDVTGDGLAEVATTIRRSEWLGAPTDQPALLYTSEQLAASSSFAPADAHLVALQATDTTGADLSICDWDADGLGDLLFGVSQDVAGDGTAREGLHLLSGATLIAGGVISTPDQALARPADATVRGFDCGGDLDGDGRPDLVIEHRPSSSAPGEVQLFPGSEAAP